MSSFVHVPKDQIVGYNIGIEACRTILKDTCIILESSPGYSQNLLLQEMVHTLKDAESVFLKAKMDEEQTA